MLDSGETIVKIELSFGDNYNVSVHELRKLFLKTLKNDYTLPEEMTIIVNKGGMSPEYSHDLL